VIPFDPSRFWTKGIAALGLRKARVCITCVQTHGRVTRAPSAWRTAPPDSTGPNRRCGARQRRSKRRRAIRFDSGTPGGEPPHECWSSKRAQIWLHRQCRHSLRGSSVVPSTGSREPVPPAQMKKGPEAVLLGHPTGCSGGFLAVAPAPPPPPFISFRRTRPMVTFRVTLLTLRLSSSGRYTKIPWGTCLEDHIAE
jgi:hypothetical protein